MSHELGVRKHNITAVGVAVMLYCLVASGAFGIEEIIPAVGPGTTLILLAVFPLVWALPICSMVAECSSLMPVEGGVYEWAKAAFGPFWGFQAAWWVTLDIYIAGGTYVALATGYLGQMLGLGDIGMLIVKVLMIGGFAFVNLRGFKHVERTDKILAAVIVGVFALVSVVGFLNWQTSPIEPVVAPGLDASTLSQGVFLCIWMFCGFESIASMGGEFRDATAIPRGLKIALPLIALSYFLPTLASLAALPEGSWQLWGIYNGPAGGTQGYASVLNVAWGGLGSVLFLVVAVIAECAIYNTYLASGSRILFAMARDGVMPRKLSNLSPNSRIPYVGIIAISVAALVFSQLQFAELVELEAAFILATYLILSATTLRLRKLYPTSERKASGKYAVRGGKVGIVICAALPMIIASAALLISDVNYFRYGMIALGSGGLCYPVFRRIFKKPSEDAVTEIVEEKMAQEVAAEAPEVAEALGAVRPAAEYSGNVEIDGECVVIDPIEAPDASKSRFARGRRKARRLTAPRNELVDIAILAGIIFAFCVVKAVLTQLGL